MDWQVKQHPDEVADARLEKPILIRTHPSTLC
jgi:hypothetical protein